MKDIMILLAQVAITSVLFFYLMISLFVAVGVW